MSSKRWVALGIAAALFFLSVAVNTATSSITGQWLGMLSADDGGMWIEKSIQHGNGVGKIAVLHVNGVIQEGYDTQSIFESVSYNHHQFLAMLQHAGEDPFVDGIIIRVNSPGGGVVESGEIHDAIVEIQQAYEKPIYVSMAGMAASGGYYIAAPADKIFAHEATITGSLGVIMQTINVSELAEKYGIRMETIKSGEYKDIMSSTREMTEAERDILQALIDDSYEKFVDIIADGRKMERDRAQALADGRIYSGKQALELGLIDGLGNLDTTIAALQKEIGLGEIDVIEYETPFSFPSFLTLTAQNLITKQQDPLGLKQLVKQANSPSLLYLYSMD